MDGATSTDDGSGGRIDKRDLAKVFKERLATLVGRHDGNLSRFADRAGVDRSALSQFLAEETTRLPRAETLARIAAAHGVSLDWLLGLSQSEAELAEVAPTLEFEHWHGPGEDAQLARWHREALGYKIRYVPATVPDLLRHEDLTAYEFRLATPAERESQSTHARRQLDYSRRPETDMEVCMPMQTLDHIARGEGQWSDLDAATRRAQLELMAGLLGDLYPTLRLFLYDARKVYSAAYTIFGPLRAAVFLGRAYIVVNAVEHIRSLIQHFDDLIRHAEIGPDRTVDYIRKTWL